MYVLILCYPPVSAIPNHSNSMPIEALLTVSCIIVKSRKNRIVMRFYLNSPFKKSLVAPVAVLGHLAFAVPKAGVAPVLLGALWGHSLILFLKNFLFKI